MKRIVIAVFAATPLLAEAYVGSRCGTGHDRQSARRRWSDAAVNLGLILWPWRILKKRWQAKSDAGEQRGFLRPARTLASRSFLRDCRRRWNRWRLGVRAHLGPSWLQCPYRDSSGRPCTSVATGMLRAEHSHEFWISIDDSASALPLSRSQPRWLAARSCR